MKHGFTLIEVSVVVAMMAILLSISTFNLFNFHDKAYIDTTTESLMSDLKSQQLKSMSGNLESGTANVPFGIRIESNRYILFSGNTYSSTAVTNYTVSVNSAIQLSTTFAQNQVMFTKGSGELQGFTAGNNTITIIHTPSALQKRITINRYGVITNIQ